MTVYLNRYKAKTVDLKEYYETYESSQRSYKLLVGAPLLVNVEGSYVNANDLPNLVVNKSKLFAVNQWLIELKNPQLNTKHSAVLNFMWRR